MEQNQENKSKSKWPRYVLTGCFVIFCLYQIVSVFIWQREKNHPKWTVERIKELEDGTITNSKLLSSIDSVTAHAIARCTAEKIAGQYDYSIMQSLPEQMKNGDSATFKEIVLLMNSCISPYLPKIELQRETLHCVDTSMNNDSLTQMEAEAYCNCYLRYLQSKYKTLKLSDSARLSESQMAEACRNAVVDTTR